MRVRVEIDRSVGRRTDVLAVGDSVTFEHQAEVKLWDGRRLPAGPARTFSVKVLGFAPDEMLLEGGDGI